MNPTLEIIKAYCALKKIGRIDDSVLSGIEEYERFKAIYEGARAKFHFRFCVYSSEKLSIFMEGSGQEILPCVSKEKAVQGELFIGKFLFKLALNKDEICCIQHFSLHDDKPVEIKSHEELRTAMLNSFSRTYYWTMTRYKIAQKFFGAVPEKFEEHRLNYRIKRIAKVFECDDTRYYFNEQDSSSKRARIKLDSAKPEYTGYNYIDEGRYYSDNVYFEMGINPDLITAEIVSEIESTASSNVVLITKDLFERFQGKLDINARKGKIEREYKQGMIEKAKKGVDWNGIFISGKAIRQGSKELRIFGKDLTRLIQDYIEFEKKPSFDDITEDFIRYLHHNEKGKANIQLGIHRLEIERTIKGYNEEKININGISLGNCDYQILMNRICRIKSGSILAKYLRNVSMYGFVLADKLNKDIFMKISNEGKDEYIKFKVRGIKGRLFIDNGRVSLSINNASFLNSAVKESLGRASILDVIKYLIEDGRHEGMKVLRFLREARRSYIQAQKRSVKYLRDAVSETNAKKAIVEVDGKRVRGYRVKGALSEYFVTNEAKVYRLPGKKYVCIYEPDQNCFINDTIGNRLYTLRDDMSFKDGIGTLRTE